MYATVTRRKPNEARIKESRERGQREYIPKLRKAPGFVTMYLIAEEGENVAVAIWESKAHADAFKGEREGWSRTLEAEYGHRVVSQGGGEVVSHTTPEK